MSDQLVGEYEMLKGGISWVLSMARSGSQPEKGEVSDAMSKAGVSFGLKKQYVDWVLGNHSSFEHYEGKSREVPSVGDVEVLRKLASRTQGKVVYARHLLSCLSTLHRESWVKDPVIYAVYLSLSGTPFNEVPEEERREVLHEVGLGSISDMIPLTTQSGLNRREYIRPEEAFDFSRH